MKDGENFGKTPPSPSLSRIFAMSTPFPYFATCWNVYVTYLCIWYGQNVSESCFDRLNFIIWKLSGHIIAWTSLSVHNFFPRIKKSDVFKFIIISFWINFLFLVPTIKFKQFPRLLFLVSLYRDSVENFEMFFLERFRK